MGTGCVADPLCFSHEFMHFFGGVYDEYEGAVDDGINNDSDDEIDECKENQSGKRCFDGGNDGQPCSAAADCPDGLCRQITCIDPGPPAAPTSEPGCLMQCCLANTDSEMCADANHDPNHDTEQSQCRDDDSCWTHFGKEWPSVILVPTDLPDPGPATAPAPVTFITPSVLDRFVAVIDRSDSMNSETPPRIELAVNAAKDFVDLLSNGSEFGLVSFASSDGGNPPDTDATKDFPEESGLRALAGSVDRNEAKSAIDDLLARTGGLTRIGEGLRVARDAFFEGGGAITLNSSILLFTDGINNRPEDNPDGDLNDALDELAADSLPVFVSCIGQARDSVQCAAIADRSNGGFVDSALTPNLYDAFVDFIAKAEGSGIANIDMNVPIATGELSAPVEVLVEEGTTLGRFVLSWTDAVSDLDLQLFRPDGTQQPMSSRFVGSQGEFYRVINPSPGIWTLRAFANSAVEGEAFSARTLVDNSVLGAEAGLARSAITWPSGFLVSMTPSIGRPISDCLAFAVVDKPDGTRQGILLNDDGRGGDADPDDGVYGTLFTDFTAGDGIYTFKATVSCQEGVARVHSHDDPGIGPFPMDPVITDFERVFRFSGFVSGVPENLAPRAKICQDQRAECVGALTSVNLDASCSVDPDSADLDYQWSSPTGTFSEPGAASTAAAFPLGRNSIEVVVTDAEGLMSDPDQGLVIIADTLDPVPQCVGALKECTGPLTPVTTSCTAVDACDATLSTVSTALASYAVGTYSFSCTSADDSGNAAATACQVIIDDTVAPTFTFVPPALTISSCVSPNIGLARAQDLCGAVVVTSNAPTKFPLGQTTVIWSAADSSGNVRTATQVVTAELRDDPSCCPTGSNVMVGTSNNDTLTGTGGSDCILGRGAQDTINGLSGDDFISGGDGNDTISCGSGNDLVFAGTGQDRVNGDAGNDTLNGDDGDDVMSGGVGTDTLRGGQGQDTLTGDDGNDSLFGQIGDDTLNGGAGNDLLDGGGIHDLCIGGAGTNTFVSCERRQ